MFPSHHPMLARAIIEERHQAAARARVARQARRPAFRRDPDAAPETGR